MTLFSPVSRLPLRPDTAYSVSDGAGERWPVVDGIAYLRTGRDALVSTTLERLDGGDRAGALVVLLADQDDWWTGPPAEPDSLAALVRDADALTFREAMAHLRLGRVGDYFAHRWSDPTYLAALALMEAHAPEGGWAAPARAFELACGAGHFLGELSRRGVACTGADVVFAKLWLARRWVAGPATELVCFDAAAPWPVTESFTLTLCHDALYFLEPKAEIVARLRGLTEAGGLSAVAHVHNSAWPNLSAGAAVSAAELEALFPDAIVYDDAELTRALAEARTPRPQPWSELDSVEAFSLVAGDVSASRPVLGGLAMPSPHVALALNPLYDAQGVVTWPSERYRAEYAARATYPPRATAGRDVAAIRSRERVSLPERW